MEKLTIAHWSESDQPREKLRDKGPQALSDAELLAILIGSGTPGISAVELMQEVLSNCNNSLNISSITAENYQMLIDTSLKPFEVLPQITVRNFTPLPGMSLYNTFEFANFSHTSENKQDGNFEGKRYHMQSKLQLPLIQQPFFQLDSNLRMMFTHYDQTVLGDQLLWYYTGRGFTNIASSVNRFIPTFQIQARLIMDNDFSLFGHNFSQSLEPIIQYYYAPYRNQDDIGLYDTTNIIQDYFFIFDDNKYAGIDRITDDNRLSTGLNFILNIMSRTAAVHS